LVLISSSVARDLEKVLIEFLGPSAETVLLRQLRRISASTEGLTPTQLNRLAENLRASCRPAIGDKLASQLAMEVKSIRIPTLVREQGKQDLFVRMIVKTIERLLPDIGDAEDFLELCCRDVGVSVEDLLHRNMPDLANAVGERGEQFNKFKVRFLCGTLRNLENSKIGR